MSIWLYRCGYSQKTRRGGPRHHCAVDAPIETISVLVAPTFILKCIRRREKIAYGLVLLEQEYQIMYMAEDYICSVLAHSVSSNPSQIL